MNETALEKKEYRFSGIEAAVILHGMGVSSIYGFDFTTALHEKSAVIHALRNLVERGILTAHSDAFELSSELKPLFDIIASSNIIVAAFSDASYNCSSCAYCSFGALVAIEPSPNQNDVYFIRSTSVAEWTAFILQDCVKTSNSLNETYRSSINPNYLRELVRISVFNGNNENATANICVYDCLTEIRMGANGATEPFNINVIEAIISQHVTADRR